ERGLLAHRGSVGHEAAAFHIDIQPHSIGDLDLHARECRPRQKERPPEGGPRSVRSRSVLRQRDPGLRQSVRAGGHGENRRKALQDRNGLAGLHVHSVLFPGPEYCPRAWHGRDSIAQESSSDASDTRGVESITKGKPMTASGNKGVALVIGAGDATGGAIAKRFAAGGYVACVTRREADKLQPLVGAIEAAGGRAHGYGSDARKEEDVVALFDRIEREIGPVDALV